MLSNAPRQTFNPAVLERELQLSLEETRRAAGVVAAAVARLKLAIQATLTDATQDRIAYDTLWLAATKEELERMTDLIAPLEPLNAQRAGLSLDLNERFSFEAYGYKFTLDGELLPTPPSVSAPEYADFRAWFQQGTNGENSRGPVFKEEFSWKSLKVLCEERAEKGLPPPPHIKMSPKIKIKVARVKEH